MEEVSSIESRTRASFRRVKRDIDALKTQVARLRDRDDKLDHALSDYARTGELYERLKAIDERFSSLSDEYITADEFSRGVERLVKETARISKRLEGIEKKDLGPEVAALRTSLEHLERRTLDRATFDAFSKKASSRVSSLDDSVAKIENRLKRVDDVDKRLASLDQLAQLPERVTAHEKALTGLEGLDAKKLAKRLDAIEKRAEKGDAPFEKRLAAVERELKEQPAQQASDVQLTELSARLDAIDKRLDETPAHVSEARVSEIVDSSLRDVVHVSELNAKIDEFNAALETVADAERLGQLEAAIAELRAIEGADERAAAATESLRLDITAEIERLSDRLSQFEASLADVIGAASDGSASADVSALSERLERLESSLGDAPIRDRLDEIEAQNNAVLAELSEAGGSNMNTRVIEDLARDVGQLQTRLEELAEEHELIASATKKGAKNAVSVDHLQEEIEFLRNNVAMQEEIEALRAEVKSSVKAPSGKGANADDSRVTVLSEDLRTLFERQSELEKKVSSLETQNRALRAEAKNEDPLWDAKAASKPAKGDVKSAQIAEKVPLREAKRKQAEQAPAEVIEEAVEEAGSPETKPGTLGKVRRWFVDFFTEEVDDEKNARDQLY